MSLSSKHSAEVILLFSNRSTIMASFCRYLQYFYYLYEIAWYKKKKQTKTNQPMELLNEQFLIYIFKVLFFQQQCKTIWGQEERANVTLVSPKLATRFMWPSWKF